MRILYGHDYYDSALAWGQDESVLFVRERNRILQESDLYNTGIYGPAGVFNVNTPRGKCVYLTDNDYQESYNVGHTIRTCGVWIADKFWQGVKIISLNHGIQSHQHLWTWSALEKWCAQHDLEIVGNNKSSTYDYLLGRHGVRINKTWFGQKDSKKSVIDYMIANRITVITATKNKFHWGSQWDYQANGDNLKSLEFYKACDAFSVFQMISQWQGGVLAAGANPMVEIKDDKIKAHKHGFDAWSFRKPPEDKK